MIYTVTLNPSLDYVMSAEHITTGAVNRITSTHYLAGGKGLNVAVVATALGEPVTALGFIAGFTGSEVERLAQRGGYSCRFIRLENGSTRINVKLKAEAETELNAAGPVITENDIEQLKRQLSGLTDSDFLVLAGSVPPSVKKSIYAELMAFVAKSGARVIVDASGELLTAALPEKPFLIKPNNHELAELFGDIGGNVEAPARKLQEMGARNVLVSLAGDGAMLLDESGTAHYQAAPRGEVKNSVGAGDSMVAGFISGYLRSGDYETALLTGIAAGSASAFSDDLATGGEINALLKILQRGL